ncbi:hypothetical protein [Fulvimarina sp. MAC3]|uniref:hypothetical protein n=1 Tax=Fulvimarina sp. MAC3 TaxID=3148887 RepID=UPI0031FDA5F8
MTLRPAPTRTSLVLGTALLLSGCCSNVTTDPRAGGLAGGVCGNVTGAYDQRVAMLQAKAGDLDTANARLQGRLTSQRQVAGSLAAELSAKRRRLAALERKLASKRAALARGQADARELAALKRERNALVAEVTDLKTRSGRTERPVLAMERGMREAAEDRTRRELAGGAAPVPVERVTSR